MTPCPPPSSEDSSLPPRHRLSLEKLRNESLEDELWNLDDETKSPDSLPAPLQTSSDPEEGDLQPPHHELESPPAADESSLMEPHPKYEAASDPKQVYRITRPTESAGRRPTDQNDLGELEGIEDWDDNDIPMPVTQAATDIQMEPTIPPSEIPLDPSATPDEPASLVPPHSVANRRKTWFTRNEIISIASVALVLMMIAGFFLINALSGLPRITDPHQQPELPATGDHFVVNSLTSYWRVPINTGPDADTVQRGTELMPVLEITVTGEDAALRVQFRNSNGEAVGDPITHTVRGETKIVIPSTAGLEDINIHNAYRTNLIDPWTAEILEASAGTTAGSAFRSLITVPISPNRR